MCYNKDHMKIGIESERANHAQKTGVEHYAHQLILHLAQIDKIDQYILYLRTQAEPWLQRLPGNFLLKIIPFPKFWTQIRLSWEMLVSAPDVLFIPASAMPFIHPKRSVVTMHDVAWVHYPEAFTWFMRTFLHWSTKFAVRRASKIIAVSEATKQDLIKHFGVAPGKVVVVLHGYSAEEIGHDKLSDEVQKQLPEKYILFLSTLQPRKNLPFLINAFRELKRQHPELPHKLVVVGKPGWQYESILKKIKDNSDIVVYLNHISDSDRWAVYRKADLFVHPSLYEGFGMWILEAFACQVPVLVSGVSSLPEVGGDGAWYFDPTNQEELVTKMSQLLGSQELRDELVRKGQARLQDFSWKKCAQETLAVIQSA